MGLEIVLKEIEDSANKKIEAINLEAQKESENIIEKARKQARETLGSRIAEAEEQISKKRQQILSSANLEVKRLQLNKKKELLDDVYLKAIEKINSIKQEKNEEFLSLLIKNHTFIDSKIHSNSISEPLIRKISKLEYGNSIDCIGGIIIESNDKYIKEDYTYDTILKNVYERNLKPISDILNG